MRTRALFFILLLFTAFACAPGIQTSEKQNEIARATQRLGEQYYTAGEYTAALKNLLDAYNTLPDDPQLNNSLGLTYMAKERYDLAVTHFKKALVISPDYVQAKNNLGAAYLKQEKWDLAIECFEAVSKNLLYPTPEVPLSNLGWVYYNQGHYLEAQTYFERSLDIAPDFLISVHGLVSTLMQIGQYRQALGYVKSKLNKFPDVAVLHADMARILEATGDTKGAKRAWKTVLSLVSDSSPLAKEARGKL